MQTVPLEFNTPLVKVQSANFTLSRLPAQHTPFTANHFLFMSRNSVQLQSLKMSLWISFLLVCTPLLLNHFTPLKPLNSSLTLKQLLLAYHLLQFSTVGIQTALNSLSAVRKYHPILAHFGLMQCLSISLLLINMQTLTSSHLYPSPCYLLAILPSPANYLHLFSNLPPVKYHSNINQLQAFMGLYLLLQGIVLLSEAIHRPEQTKNLQA